MGRTTRTDPAQKIVLALARWHLTQPLLLSLPRYKTEQVALARIIARAVRYAHGQRGRSRPR